MKKEEVSHMKRRRKRRRDGGGDEDQDELRSKDGGKYEVKATKPISSGNHPPSGTLVKLAAK